VWAVDDFSMFLAGKNYSTMQGIGIFETNTQAQAK
jgi:hypothetical protein